MNNIKLVVRNIIGEAKDGISRVTVSSELFAAMQSSIRARYNRTTPALTYVGKGDEGGHGVRVFTVDGKEIYNHYDKESGKTFLFMKTEDAQACLLTLADERAKEPKLGFDVSKFDLAIVATA